MVQNKSGGPRTPSRPPARPRGRPPAYDREEALDRARDLFWTQGFSATSLDELSAATKMNRPSLYGAFGDKRALYHATLERYRRQVGETLIEIFKSDTPLRDTLNAVYRHALDIYFPKDDRPRGCFIVSIGVPESRDDPQAQDIVASAMRGFDGLFEARFRMAVKDGELPAGTDCAMLARLASSVVHFLSIRSRSGERREALARYAAFAVDQICSPGAKTDAEPADP